MKTTATKNVTEEEIIFPCLMISSSSGIIILATGKDTSNNSLTGTIVHVNEANNDGLEIGEYSEDWATHQFEPYKGKVELIS